MLQELRVDEPVPAGGADRRNNEYIGKIGNIFCLIQVFDFSIAGGTRTRDDALHLRSTNLVARDLHGHGGQDDIALVAEADDIAVDVLCNFF